MRILQITDELPPHTVGGSGRIAWETAKGLAARGYESHVLTAAPAGTFPASIDGVTLHVLLQMPKRFAHYRGVFSRRRERDVTRVLHAIRPDVVHSHGTAWHFGYRWMSSAAESMRVVYTAHGVMHVAYGKVIDGEELSVVRELRRVRWEYNPLRNRSIRAQLSQCSVLLCVSDALRVFLERNVSLPMQTLHNGIDLETWRDAMRQHDARALLDLPQDRAIFLIAGRLGSDKGTDAVDRTLPDDALLLAAGEIPSNTFPNLGGRVRRFSRQDEERMLRLYAACDAVLVPSLYLDPFPTVCLEAMACNRPVVATACGGAKEAVLDGVTGWVVNPHDERALAAQLRWCTDYRAALPEFGAAARRRVEDTFSLEKYLDSLEKIYLSDR